MAAGAAACGASLTQAGAQVRHAQKGPPPPECSILGEVTVGQPTDAIQPKSREAARVKMRNQAGAIGGDFLLIDVFKRQTDEQGQVRYLGRGRAYDCSDSASQP
jgi:hypothetical protein